MSDDFGFFAVRTLRGYGPVVVRGDAVVVVALTPDARIWLARIHRPAIARSSWECPGGAVEPGELAVAAARRELLEECGLQGGTARLWPTPIEPAPGMARFPHHVVRLRGVLPRDGTARPQRSEGVEAVRAFSPARVVQLIARGELVSQPTLSALLVTGVLD